MIDINELALRLQNKFRNVPNVTLVDCTDWMLDAINLHGLTVNDTLPAHEVPVVILLGQSIGARNIALQTAHYFSYQDGDESVDKTMLAERYTALANEFYNAYITNKRGNKGAVFTIITRADR